MNSARSFPFPASQTAATMSPTRKENKSASSVCPTTPNRVAGINYRKQSSTVHQPPLPTYHSVDWQMSTPPLKPSGILASNSSPELSKAPNDTLRRRGDSIAQSIYRLFHLDHKDDDHGNGMDFECCGEAPPRPPRRAGWLGTLDLEEPAASHVPAKAGVALASKTPKLPDAVGVLGSPWFPSNNCGQAMISPFGGSPPPLSSSGSSPDSAESSLASPSYISDLHAALGSPGSYLASNYAMQSLHFTPPRKNLAKSFGGPNAGPSRRQKTSIDTISVPIMKDLKINARSAPKSQH